MTIQINFILHGDLPESGTMSSCFVQSPVSLQTIRNVFPFDGQFHFRVKRQNIIPGHSHVWVDLTKESDEVVASDDIIDIQALVISLPDITTEDDANDYVLETQNILKEAILDDHNRPNRQSIKSENLGAGVDPITLATNTAYDIAKGMQMTSPYDNLNKLNTLLTTTYDEGQHKHNALLQDVWAALFPGHPFERESPKWREAGWQKPNPVADLKTSGILGLKCMRYLGQHYPADTLRMVSSQKENIKSHYPFAVVGINMTLMLCEVIGIREKRFQDRQEASSGYYEMFEDKHAFYEIFCICFLFLDTVWNQRGCVRADFGPLMGEIKGLVISVMKQFPQNLDQFKMLAIQSGLGSSY